MHKQNLQHERDVKPNWADNIARSPVNQGLASPITKPMPVSSLQKEEMTSSDPSLEKKLPAS